MLEQKIIFININQVKILVNIAAKNAAVTVLFVNDDKTTV
jgi:hypothetical protein